MENPQGAQIDEIERVIEGTTKNCFGVDVAFGRNAAGEPGIYVGKDNWWGSFVHAKWESLAWMVHIWE